ncbi:HipA N-terminal domain-containing protein [Rhodospirillum centenum]|uniref:HipA protein, putative n=1 Tax=Rhodospirillum centenum (strain ATCC 51521 / SW) TaxID=414684 RepID=B6IW01_RHOCS|nr:HipA N-terminal domain-containing protein [Rhodospirillum centenum]ACJ00475.1 HipA protein, putative [Rhodospirillum centenum SW]
MNGPLSVLLAGTEIGELSSRKGRCVLRYREPHGDDRGQPVAALSLSLPRDREEHAGEAVANFLWGLLPDNEAVLQRWGQRFGVSPRNVLALLGHVGEDCAGAVQIVRPDRLAAIREPRPLEVDWLDEADIAARLRALRADPAQGRRLGPALAMGGNRVQDRIAALLDRVPPALEETADKMADQRLTHSVLDRLRTTLPDWIEARRRAMRGT